MTVAETARKILVAGDTHGEVGWVRHLVGTASENGCATILQLGDFGYWEHANRGRNFLDWTEATLAEHEIDLWWIDGNHENHQMLRETYKPRDDGLCEIRPHILYVPRGHRWEWDDVSFLGLGGAFSVDKRWRIEGESWWPEETITEGDVIRATSGGPVDVMVSHDCPWGVDCMGFETVGDKDDWPESKANRCRLLAVVAEVKPRLLFHDHYHHRHTHQLEGRDFATRVEGLGRDGDPCSYVVLDLAQFRDLMAQAETDVDLDAIEAAAKAATSGAWQVAIEHDEFDYDEQLPDGGVSHTTEYIPYQAIRTVHDERGSWEVGRAHHEADAQFIAAASPAVVLRLVALARANRAGETDD